MNEAQGLREKNLHEFRVTNRRQMTIDGVKDVIGFDENVVQLLTVGGDMTIEGSELRIKVLDVERGAVVLEGRIDALSYVEETATERRSFWSRLTR